MRSLRQLLPSPGALRSSRWLRWLGPALFHPGLWHLRRRSLAIGVAIGVFFGLLVPLGQIPLSAGAALVLRANVPSAIAATFVTNPLTFGPIYFAAWRVGTFVVGDEAGREAGPAPPDPARFAAVARTAEESWWQATRRRVEHFGKPLLVGLALFAMTFGLLAYYAVLWIWAARTWIARRFHTHQQRRAAKRERAAQDTDAGN